MGIAQLFRFLVVEPTHSGSSPRFDTGCRIYDYFSFSGRRRALRLRDVYGKKKISQLPCIYHLAIFIYNNNKSIYVLYSYITMTKKLIKAHFLQLLDGKLQPLQWRDKGLVITIYIDAVDQLINIGH